MASSPRRSVNIPRAASPTRNGSGASPSAEADRRLERAALRFRQTVARLEERKQQLMKPGEGESRLGRDARRRDDGHAAFACSQRDSREQRRLPDPGLSAQDERTATLPDPVDQAVQLRQLAVSAE